MQTASLWLIGDMFYGLKIMIYFLATFIVEDTIYPIPQKLLIEGGQNNRDKTIYIATYDILSLVPNTATKERMQINGYGITQIQN